MTENQPEQNEPELWELIRRVLRAVCWMVAFFSAFEAATGAITAVQILNDEVRAARVVAIVGYSKGHTRVRLDTGDEVSFSEWALRLRPPPIRLAVGDRVEKRRESCVYVLNGEALSDFSWLLRDVVLPVRLLVPLGLYLVLGSIYVVKFGRAPLADTGEAKGEAEHLRRRRRRGRAIAWLLAEWFLVFVLMLAFFGCVGGCVFGMGRKLFL